MTADDAAVMPASPSGAYGPAAAGKFRFGDIIEADWLFDLYLRSNARPLYKKPKGYGNVPFEMYLTQPPDRPNPPPPRPTDPPRPGNQDDLLAAYEDDFAVLAHGNSHLAVVLTDDCEIDSLWDRDKGRLLLCAIGAYPPEDDAKRLREKPPFDRFLLEPEGEFVGGLIRFERVFAAATKDLKTKAPRRFALIDAEARLRLLSRWCAHATRHGPDLAADVTGRLAKLMTANADSSKATELHENRRGADAIDSDAVRPVFDLLQKAWLLEGVVLDPVGERLRDGEAPEATLDAVIITLEAMRADADAGIAALTERRTQLRPAPATDDAPPGDKA